MRHRPPCSSKNLRRSHLQDATIRRRRDCRKLSAQLPKQALRLVAAHGVSPCDRPYSRSGHVSCGGPGALRSNFSQCQHNLRISWRSRDTGCPTNKILLQCVAVETCFCADQLLLFVCDACDNVLKVCQHELFCSGSSSRFSTVFVDSLHDKPG